MQGGDFMSEKSWILSEPSTPREAGFASRVPSRASSSATLRPQLPQHRGLGGPEKNESRM